MESFRGNDNPRNEHALTGTFTSLVLRELFAELTPDARQTVEHYLPKLTVTSNDDNGAAACNGRGDKTLHTSKYSRISNDVENAFDKMLWDKPEPRRLAMTPDMAPAAKALEALREVLDHQYEDIQKMRLWNR